jgi:lipocalin
MRFALEKTEYSIVDLPTEKAKHFLAVPSKQHLWILTPDDRVIRYSLRSPPPALWHG